VQADAHDWVARTADDVIAEAERRATGKPILCASGISPSGPILIGNLREIMVPHLVADEIRSRGIDCEHLLYWDDFDRLRKVPAGVDPSFAEHIGRPLSRIPDPSGEYPSWAERYKAPFRAALAELGVAIREVSQAERYTSGAYTPQVLTAISRRREVGATLARYQTKKKPVHDEDLAAAAGETAAGEDSGAADEEDSAGATEYFPYRVYCENCGRDTTTMTRYDDATTTADYTCSYCDYHGTVVLRDQPEVGKLVWKVDWPMRWADGQVVFEAAGTDHSSPGSSFTVGSDLVRNVFGAEPPVYLAYSFVGIRGMAKMSGSSGGAPTPADALRILEAPILRWVYTRRRPNQSITVDFGAEVGRLYDEWDALNRRVAEGKAPAWEGAVLHRSAETTTAGRLPQPRRVFPFRMLASVSDIAAGDDAQILRILNQAGTDDEPVRLDDVEPRLSRAKAWVAEHVPAEQRTHVRTEPALELLTGLGPDERAALRVFLDRLDESWSLDGLTSLVYGVPKVRLGLPEDAKPTPELKTAQRQWFILLYRLLVGAETGPRLPTLLLSIGKERLVRLLDADTRRRAGPLPW
jgi:lysyl-tRNA synthetase class 1